MVYIGARDFWVCRLASGAYCISLNLGHNWVADAVWICSHRLGQSEFDQILGQRNVVMDLDRLADVFNGKQV